MWVDEDANCACIVEMLSLALTGTGLDFFCCCFLSCLKINEQILDGVFIRNRFWVVYWSNFHVELPECRAAYSPTEMATQPREC